MIDADGDSEPCWSHVARTLLGIIRQRMDTVLCQIEHKSRRVRDQEHHYCNWNPLDGTRIIFDVGSVGNDG